MISQKPMKINKDDHQFYIDKINKMQDDFETIKKNT